MNAASAIMEKLASKRRGEKYVEGSGTVESYSEGKTKDHDEIVIRTRDGRRIRISNNTRLGKALKARAGSRVGYHGYSVDGTDVVHKVHPNKSQRGGWLEDLGGEKAASAQKVVVVDRYGRKAELKSLVKAVLYLTGIGSLPEAEIERMVRGREPLINGMRVFYPSGQEKEADADRLPADAPVPGGPSARPVPELRADDRSWGRRAWDGFKSGWGMRMGNARANLGRVATRFGFKTPRANAETLYEQVQRNPDLMASIVSGIEGPVTRKSIRDAVDDYIREVAESDAVEYLRSKDPGSGIFDSSMVGRALGGEVPHYDMEMYRGAETGRPVFLHRRSRPRYEVGGGTFEGAPYPNMGPAQSIAAAVSHPDAAADQEKVNRQVAAEKEYEKRVAAMQEKAKAYHRAGRPFPTTIVPRPPKARLHGDVMADAETADRIWDAATYIPNPLMTDKIKFGGKAFDDAMHGRWGGAAANLGLAFVPWGGLHRAATGAFGRVGGAAATAAPILSIPAGSWLDGRLGARDRWSEIPGEDESGLRDVDAVEGRRLRAMFPAPEDLGWGPGGHLPRGTYVPPARSMGPAR